MATGDMKPKKPVRQLVAKPEPVRQLVARPKPKSARAQSAAARKKRKR